MADFQDVQFREACAAKAAAILHQRRALLRNTHVVLASGKHGNAYVNKDELFPEVEDVAELCAMMAALFWRECPEGRVQVVVGPVVGGAILAQHVVTGLKRCSGRSAAAIYADKVGQKNQRGEMFALKRGYDQKVRDRDVLIVEDVLTTGGSVANVVGAVREAGGNVIGVAALVNRGGVTAEDIGVPHLTALVNLTLETWNEDECPLCAAGEPVNTMVGKGAEFLERKHKRAAAI